jgi:hypothetical protein
MKFRLAFIPLLFPIAALAQQWIDKQYDYTSTLNVVYGAAINFNNGIDTLKMNIYTPVCDNSTPALKRPLLVWVHGGAFLAGNKDDPSITNLCQQFAKRGYVTASIDYRLGFISDNNPWNCNYPNYSCVFASDSAEWHRALYRGIQDGKGAVRYLVNRYAQLGIDTSNVFVAGESAGAFVALGVALLDTTLERMPQTYQIADAPKPSPNTASCIYNLNKIFSSNTIPRPDLGGIEGGIAPTTIRYTIKAVGNMYGAVTNDLLKYHKANQPKPAIFSFHQPCDLVVPIDSGVVYQGLSWCFTNGYNCYGIAHTPKVYGSRIISKWNTVHNYGYNIHDEFTGINFPFNFLFGQGSCADQINNPCHAYDNTTLREGNLANFFSEWITTSPPLCDSTNITQNITPLGHQLSVFPNPAQDKLTVQYDTDQPWELSLLDMYGRVVFQRTLSNTEMAKIEMAAYPNGLYLIVVTSKKGPRLSKVVVKI